MIKPEEKIQLPNCFTKAEVHFHGGQEQTMYYLHVKWQQSDPIIFGVIVKSANYRYAMIEFNSSYCS